MIPKIIHYCWFGRGEMPQLAKDCIASWHTYMPDWDYRLWNEDNFDVYSVPYTKEAYEARKFAFVSDYVRLKALNEVGGIYLDTDVMVYKSFEPLLTNFAFAGFEGSKHIPVATCVLGSVSQGDWISEQQNLYEQRHFVMPDGTFDITTNVQFMTKVLQAGGLIQNGKEQYYKDLHVYPVDYFCPRQTTGEYIRTCNTYCEHMCLASWSESKKGWKGVLLSLVNQKTRTKLIKLKRRIVGRMV